MKLIKYSDNPEAYLNMDYIESIIKNEEGIFVYVNRNSLSYKISKKAYDTILSYGKAEV